MTPSVGADSMHDLVGVLLLLLLAVASVRFGVLLVSWWLERRYVVFEPEEWENDD